MQRCLPGNTASQNIINAISCRTAFSPSSTGNMLAMPKRWSGSIPGKAANLRLKVFGMAAKFHPLVETKDRLFDHSSIEVKEGIAAEIGRPWGEICDDLFADGMEYHRLIKFDGFKDPRGLLAGYNIMWGKFKWRFTGRSI